MEKFKYGPLIWNCINEDDESGNYFWNGKPPVEYDRMNIPIDEEGMQCLPIASPVHPTWQPDEKQFVFNDFLRVKIPSINQAKEWFDDNFLVITEKKIMKYIYKWCTRNLRENKKFLDLVRNAESFEEVTQHIWQPGEPK